MHDAGVLAGLHPSGRDSDPCSGRTGYTEQVAVVGRPDENRCGPESSACPGCRETQAGPVGLAIGAVPGEEAGPDLCPVARRAVSERQAAQDPADRPAATVQALVGPHKPGEGVFPGRPLAVQQGDGRVSARKSVAAAFELPGDSAAGVCEQDALGQAPITFE